MSPKEPIDFAKEIAAINIKDINEARTRQIYIDSVFYDVFQWPKVNVPVEDHTNTGFIDYKFVNSSGRAILILEAKKTGNYFELPSTYNDRANSFFCSVKVLLTDPAIKTAIEQVRRYCVDEGCQLAGITNGHQWIFFKAFENGKKWVDLKAFVIKNNDYYEQSFIEANNLFNFHNMCAGNLINLLGDTDWNNRELFRPSEKITVYDQKVESNRYSTHIRKFINKYFGVIDPNEQEFMNECYVHERNFEKTVSNFQAIVKDTVTPFFKDHGVEEIKEYEEFSTLTQNIKNKLSKKLYSDVIILFGGKGAGKSTFLKKMVFHNPPDFFENNAKFIFVDLLDREENKEKIKDYIYQSMIEDLDEWDILNSDRGTLLEFFKQEFELAKKQDLYGLNENSEIYNVKLNDLVIVWKADKLKVIEKLVHRWNSRNKGCIFILDNTDQFSNEIQDYCFQIAHTISTDLKCLVIISMREERYYSSRLHGTLDAYQNYGFHIASPATRMVFNRRIQYVLNKLSSPKFCKQEFRSDTREEIIKNLQTFFYILKTEFTKNNGHLNDFLNSCAHGNTRIALDLFRGFVNSGYTNIDEMVNAGRWTIQVHQVVKPLMIPDRIFYNEELSIVPNIYKVRDLKNGSHFTGVRILENLRTASIDGYTSIGVLKEYFATHFNMLSDFEENIDNFLKSGLVESNNRIDYYCDKVDSIKLTSYGHYVLTNLCLYVTYLELVSIDCALYDQKYANELSELSRTEFGLIKSYNREQRIERVETRLKKVEVFINYLLSQQQLEKERFSISMDFADRLYESFKEQSEKVLQSARKQK
ncbi:hypothetical protein NI470_07110 [Acinetobacter lwoffii]|uniref:hypothetical protein n=1 Tax=Acinetobacter TaxID=469 RepID=UPI0015D40546|nr:MULTISPECIES: hypothetical protein [Acinetobacter]MCO8073392.1 hypothetical protein [Acinetobacter lwoffii]MCO8076369.1 hypothetical protein [Acinetobacter lwoffii]